MNISKEAWIAPGAVVAGNVTMEPGSSVWFHCTIRAEEEPVVLGADTNVQDNRAMAVSCMAAKWGMSPSLAWGPLCSTERKSVLTAWWGQGPW